mmetsp:Transcript_49596/g.142739  ORF Transcript_49596/g.142739 Transcript_49596/m.142739 type:complete len:146 (-) Transcript_49596:67-504(-)
MVILSLISPVSTINSARMFRLLLSFLLLVQAIQGFTPSAQKKNVFRPANFVSAAETPSAAMAWTLLKMSEGEENAQEKISADGTFYDDEVDSAPKKQGISDDMRARLVKEASTGLDSNQKQTNVLLYIILGVAVLVVLGGAGIFY